MTIPDQAKFNVLFHQYVKAEVEGRPGLARRYAEKCAAMAGQTLAEFEAMNRRLALESHMKRTGQTN